MSHYRFVSLFGHLPEIKDFDLPALQNASDTDKQKFAQFKRRVQICFECIRLPSFSCKGQEINSDGEAAFILRQAYCQALIYASVWQTKQMAFITEKNLIAQTIYVELYCVGLLESYRQYQKKLCLAFGMISLRRSKFLTEATIKKTLEVCCTFAFDQFMFEANEICQLSKQLSIKHASPESVSSKEMDNAFTEFMNEETLQITQSQEKTNAKNAFATQVQLAIKQVSSLPE